MLTTALVRSACRPLDPERHAMLRCLSRDDMYDGGRVMAPGGLLLADLLARQLSLKAGDRVLDLGCGRGQSSVHLALHYQAQVTSVDLWIGAEERQQRAAAAGVASAITALRGDIGRGVPIAPGSLDAIFCLQSFHTFGTRPWVLGYLARLLRPGGRIGIAHGCFREEVREFPPLFAETDGWNAEYGKYHSPRWWESHFAANELLEVVHADEVMDGDIMWEDDVLYRGERSGWSPEYLEHSGWLIRQVLAGRSAPPSLTHCLVIAARRSTTPGGLPG